MSREQVKATGPHPVDLSTGQVLAPGETAHVNVTDHEQTLIDDGHLTVVTTPKSGGKKAAGRAAQEDDQ